MPVTRQIFDKTNYKSNKIINMWKCKNCNKTNDDEYKICIHCFQIKDKNENDILELSDKLQYCKLCENYKFGESGIICSLSNEKPTFQKTCENFTISQSAKEKIEVVKKRLAGEFETDSSVSRWVISIFGILGYALSKIFIFDGEHNFITGVGAFVVGALIGRFIIWVFRKS